MRGGAGGLQYGTTQEMREAAASLQDRLDAMDNEIAFEQKVERSLYAHTNLAPDRLAELKDGRTDDERQEIITKVGKAFINNLHNSAPPGVPIDRGRMRASASFVAPRGDDYEEVDSPRTAARKELERKYPKMEYTAQKPGALKPLSPRSRARFDQATMNMYNSEKGEDGETLTDDMKRKIAEFKQSQTPDYKSMAMQIYHAEEDGMEKRAIRQLQQVEAARPEQQFRERAYAVYNADPSRERFARAADELNEDEYLHPCRFSHHKCSTLSSLN